MAGNKVQSRVETRSLSHSLQGDLRQFRIIQHGDSAEPVASMRVVFPMHIGFHQRPAVVERNHARLGSGASTYGNRGLLQQTLGGCANRRGLRDGLQVIDQLLKFSDPAGIPGREARFIRAMRFSPSPFGIAVRTE